MITREAITAQVMFTVSVASFGDLELFDAFLDGKHIDCMLVSIPLNWSPCWSSCKATFINVCCSSSRFIFASQHHVSAKFLFHFQWLANEPVLIWPQMCWCNQYIMHDKCQIISLHTVVHWLLPHLQPRSLNWKMPMAKQVLTVIVQETRPRLSLLGT